MWGKELKQEVIDSGAVVVVRPDSGNPPDVVWKLAHLLADAFGYTKNSKGYKVLNHVRIIQGDGITTSSIEEILLRLKASGFSAENVAFGQGGALLQQLNRDTLKFAMKCSAAYIDGEWIDVFKDPITDKGKVSKKGRITLYHDNCGGFETIRIGHVHDHLVGDALVEVFRDGKVIKEYDFAEVRANANS